MNIAIYGRTAKKEDLEFFKILIDKLHERNCNISIWAPFLQQLTQLFDCKKAKGFRKLPDNFDLMMSIGGDGTMLDAVRLIKDKNVPICGINLGRMGFLASIPKAEIDEALDELISNKFKIEERSLICIDEPKNIIKDGNFAFNEVAINKRDAGSMIISHVWINEKYLHSFWADGLIIATPNGSTAYSLSCNGPILTPDTQNFLITPIAPHNLSVRPIVIPDNCVIRIKVESREKLVLVSADTQTARIEGNVELVLSKANFKVKFIERLEDYFFKTLRTKLNWGADVRNWNKY